MAGTVMLEERVERAIVWLFCVTGGVGVDCVMEEEVERKLRGRFAWWKVDEGLRRLQKAGVAVPVSVMVNGYSRRCWRISPEAWPKLEPFEVEEMELV